MTTDPTSNSTLRRSWDGRMLAGVAEGAARHFDFDVTIVRLAFVLLALVGPGIPLYIAGWLLIPDEGSERSVLSDLLESTRPVGP